MKKLLFLFTMLAFMVACSDDDNDNDNLPIKGLEIPQSTTPVKPGSSVTIKGEGFTKASEIWFRTIITRATESEDVKATVTEVSSTGITFTAPMVYGNQSVLLKENGKEYELGKMTFEEQPEEPQEIEILPKRIKKIIMIEDDDINDVDTITYTYDNGKIIKEKHGMKYNPYQLSIKYEGNEITENTNNPKDGNNTTYTLENGLVKKMKSVSVSDPDEEWEEYSFEYANSFLKTSTSTWHEDGDTYTETETFTVINNCITGYGDNDGEATVTHSYEYGSYEYKNNLNIDLWGILGWQFFETNIDRPFILGITGQRSHYLPVKINGEDTGEDGGKYTMELKYEKIGDYISKILIDEDGERELEIQIYYED